MDQAIEQIKLALINSISMNDQLRNQSLEFLTVQCEPNPEFQLALLHIIANNQGANSSQDYKQLQYQAILCMKNSLIRLLQVQRNRRLFKSLSLTEELKDEIKQKILALIQKPDDVILGNNSYEQLTLVACIFVKYDFPAKWVALNQWLLTNFETLYQSLNNLSIEQVPTIKRFLIFFLEVMKEQYNKKLLSSKGQFHKVAREHLKAVYQVWSFFNDQQSRMIYDENTNNLNLANFNELLFDLSSKLDKCLLNVIGCGFSLNDLINEPKNNLYVKVTAQLILKLKLYTVCVEKLSESTISNQDYYFKIFEAQIKALLKHLSDIQNAEALIIFDSLGSYVETVAQILFRGNLHNSRVKKLALFALYRVVNTMMYNQGGSDKLTHSDGIGILVSPVKFKNFEPQLLEASQQFRFVFEKSDPSSKDTQVVNRKDGARELLKLVFQHYLPLQNINMWRDEPEQFIEIEDDNYFIFEYDLDSECSTSLLAYQLLEKIIYAFYNTCYQYISEEILPSYFNGTLQLTGELSEDALLCLTGMIGKVQKDLKVTADKRLDISFVLDYIYKNKWNNPLFKRRFTHILSQWIKILPKSKFLDYFRFIMQSLSEVTDYVLIYEHCHCIHEMIKELDLWLKKAEPGQLGKLSYAQGAIFNFDDPTGADVEDQVAVCLQISKQIDYAQAFALLTQKLIPILSVFKAPKQVWNMINYLSMFLEKNADSNAVMVECFNQLNLYHLLQMESSLVDEAVLDMLKNLFAFQPSSSVILEMCASLLDNKLSKKPDAQFVHFWLFTTRAVTSENKSLSVIQKLFEKFIGYGELKKDYLAIDFLKIVQECVLLNFFTTKESVNNLTQYALTKFQFEVELENKWLQQVISSTGPNKVEIDDANLIDPTNLYEKKLNLIMIPHIMMWRCQLDPPNVLNIIFQTQLPFFVQACIYLIECQASKIIPSSSTFFTQLLTYLNRLIVISREFFIQKVLAQLNQQKGYTFQQFIDAWFSKMDFLVSQEARRINLLAIYNLLPYFSADLIKKLFQEIGKLTFSHLDSYMYLKLTNSESRLCSPSKVSFNSHLMNAKVRINQTEKISQRLEELKRSDQLQQIDIIEHFWQRMEEVRIALNLETLEPLQQFLPEEAAKQTFANLVSGNHKMVPQQQEQ